MLGILGALLGAAGFGTANIVIKKSLEDVSIPQTLTASTFSGLILLLLFTLINGWSLSFSQDILLQGFLLALLEVALYLSLYKAFAAGNVTVATAISSTYPIFATVITVFVLSQAFKLSAFFFMLLLVTGVVLTSIDWRGVIRDGFDKSDLVKGWNWIALTTVIHAIYFPFLGEFTATGLWQTKLLLIKMFSLVILVIIFSLYKQRSVVPQKNRLAMTSLLGVLEMIGWAGFAWATTVTVDSTALLIATLQSAPIITAVLAYFVLKERLTALQYVGIALVVVSLTGLAIG